MDKKPTSVTFVLSFISPLQVVQHVTGNHVPIFRSWQLRSVIATCWNLPWLQEGCQNRLGGSVSIEEFVALQLSASEDGHVVAWNMLSNL